ncbi:MAG: hypothetical protein QOG64_1668 [Acidimicrobiaceae bacterium]|nr:hypothetical protein [Acidimicrobiaceae bacterium]
MHDAVQCEAEGVPATAVITEVFTTIADGTGLSLGMPGYHYAVVPHPIWTRTPEWMRTTAEDLAGVIIEQLTSTGA